MFPSIQEFVFLVVIITLLTMTGLWEPIIRGIRQLRGEHVEDDSPPPSDQDLNVSYRLLGVSPSSTWEQIEHAYRKKAKLHHPDHGGDDDAMRALNEAYSMLKKSRKTRR